MWLGMLVVLLGGLVMVGGIIGVWVYARRHPAPPAPSPPTFAVPPTPGPLPAPPKLLPAPEEASSDDSAPSTPAPPPSARKPLSLPLAIAPFLEDAGAPVPVEAGHPLWGGRDAFVTATVFADLECPHSVELVRELLRLKARQGDELRLQYRHLPLSQHAEGRAAARALAEIHATRGEQAFWHVLTSLVRRGEPLEPGGLGPALTQAGFSGYPLASPLPRVEAALAADAELATRLFVRETPTLFVNGERASGMIPREALERVVERERRSAYLVLASGVPPSGVYADRTKKNLLNLGADPPERTCIPFDDAPVLGPENALITFVEFSELECEPCRQGDSALRAVVRAHPNDVRVVWKHFPLPQHLRARLAAGVALAARKRGGDAAFWSVTRSLLEPKTTLDDESLAKAVTSAHLDADALLEEAKRRSYDSSIDIDVKLADELGLTGAPTYFVNGSKLPGALPEAELKFFIEGELAIARRVRAQTGATVHDLACGTRATVTAKR
jgi:protein-disulfide isomerase